MGRWFRVNNRPLRRSADDRPKQRTVTARARDSGRPQYVRPRTEVVAGCVAAAGAQLLGTPGDQVASAAELAVDLSSTWKSAEAQSAVVRDVGDRQLRHNYLRFDPG
jgi:hypothetical protein